MDVGALAPTPQQLQAAVQAVIPPFASAVPKAEMTGGAAGSVAEIPRADHQHPRLTATFTGALSTGSGADAAVTAGTRYVPFTRTFTTLPAVTILEVNSPGTTPPADFKVQSFTQDANGNYTGCTIYGSRARVLPTLSSIGVAALLSGVITATNTVIQLLSGYIPYEPAGGAQFTLIALQPTTPS